MERERIFLTRAYLPKFEEYIEEIRDLWESHWITTMGPKQTRFEEELKRYLNVEAVSVFTNGHNALELLIDAMDLKGEVITTPYTFVSTAHAIVRNGLIPVFCDINKDDFTIDADKIEELITENTSAILGVHVYGNPCNIEKIKSIAERHNLKVIYDAAHAFGERYCGKNIAEYGDASIFSFHASKVFNSIEGGCAVYRDPSLKEKLYQLRYFGINGDDVEFFGTNAKMNEFVAAMGLCNLRHIDEVIHQRKQIAEYYIQQLSAMKGIKIGLNIQRESLVRNYAYFPVLIDEEAVGSTRDQIYERLNQAGIQALRQFYPLINQYTCYQKFAANLTPIAQWVSEHILLLPLYSDLTLEQVERICYLLKDSIHVE